ncbi:hypothetical protein AKO1_004225 [Acrasis kona]|uniref:Uncharacterized protein n=1 Tax=Acrasis kona TaxID=1008807 RepID=A0AAW2YHN7_9EUKA
MEQESIISVKVNLATQTLAKLTGDDDEDHSHKMFAVSLLCSAASEHAEESRWDEAANCVKLFLPFIDVLKRPKRKKMYNFAAVVFNNIGDKSCVSCQEEAIKLHVRDMEYKRAVREAESFATVLLEKDDVSNAIKFYLLAANIMERDDRLEDSFLLRAFTVIRLLASDISESMVDSNPQMDDVNNAELLFMGSLLKLLSLLSSKRLDVDTLSTSKTVHQLAEYSRERYAMFQNLVAAIQSNNKTTIENYMETLKVDDIGIIEAVKKWAVM